MNLQNKGQNLNGEYVKNYYDNFLSKSKVSYAFHRWHETVVHEEHYFQTKKVLEKAFSCISGNVLEIGGGDGSWTLLYIEKCDHITYMDISEEMLLQAKKNLSKYQNKINFIQGDFMSNNLASSSFDKIISIRNFEYFKDKNFAVSEFNRLLKSNGELLIITKSKHYSFHTKLHKKTLHSDQVTPNEFVEMLKKNNFEILEFYPAIFGKLLKFWIFRKISRITFLFILKTNYKMIPKSILGYFSESFYVKARKK